MACLSSNLSHGELVLLSSSSSTSRSLSMTAFNAALLLRARCSHFCRTPCRRVHRSSQPVSELALAKAGSTWFWITVHASMSLPMRLVMKSARQRNSPQRGMLLDRLCVLAASASNLCCIIFSTAFFMVASFRNASSSAPKWPRSGRSVAKSTSCWASSCDSRSPETLCRSHREAVSVFDRFAARSPPGLPARPRPQSKNLHVSTSLQYGASRGQKSGNEAGLMSQKWMAPTTCGTSSIAAIVRSVAAIPFQPGKGHIEDLQFMLNDKKPRTEQFHRRSKRQVQKCTKAPELCKVLAASSKGKRFKVLDEKALALHKKLRIVTNGGMLFHRLQRHMRKVTHEETVRHCEQLCSKAKTVELGLTPVHEGKHLLKNILGNIVNVQACGLAFGHVVCQKRSEIR
eukprot:CAMPEP_0172897514 /NCGR_PEP_ID=MMETSP1075-20121228/157734_1 /TAXON_ID=2916 /ORGANISM="Ceratium fusus, Strain PA161109" /LENGTH=400 /DNA_ID=CAMNT_0013753105 /DNA_START=114 /DNA_END=1315 /DNA_ORIENTATION=+